MMPRKNVVKSLARALRFAARPPETWRARSLAMELPMVEAAPTREFTKFCSFEFSLVPTLAQKS